MKMAFLNKVSYLYKMRYFYVSIRNVKTFRRTEFHDFDKILKEKFTDILVKPGNVTKETWESMRNCMIEANNQSQDIIDCLILETFKRENYLDAGINYYKFLEANDYNLSVTVASNYLLLYQQKEKLMEEEKVNVLNVCKRIVKQYELLPEFLANILVTSLCQLDEWKAAIEVINQFEAHDSALLQPGYTALINYLFENAKSELALKYLTISMEKAMHQKEDTYSIYLKYCLQKRDEFNTRIEKLFSLWRKYGLKPTKRTIDEYITVCNEHGWSAQLTTISRLQCNVCHETLKETKLSEMEFNLLFKAIIKSVITNNAYAVSSPRELKVFKAFMEQHKPYHYVIDGLNLIKSGYNAINNFKNLLECLKNHDKKVLVIGREHMKKNKKIRALLDTADFFFVHNLSKDDAFILYAAFSSGNGTNVVSRDLMRQHKFTFHNIELDTLFKRWQTMHQYIIQGTNDLVKLDLACPIDSSVQKRNNCWHIPYHMDFTKHLNKRHICNDNWACFKKCT